MSDFNSYNLSRKWFDFCFENPDKISPTHSAVYFFAIEHCNRLGWKKKFGLPTTMAMEAIGIRSYNTYKKVLTDLIQFGFISMVESSKNQYSSNIVALSNFDKALDKALDKAMIKHSTKQSESTVQSTIQSIDSIDKPITYNIEQGSKERKAFAPPSKEDVLDFMQKTLDDFTAMAQAEKFFNYYESNGWKVGKNKMKSWKASASGWISRMNEYQPKKQFEPVLTGPRLRPI